LTNGPDQYDSQLERFLDGTLDEADRIEFERELARRNGVRGEADLQSRIDDSLRRLFDPARDAKPPEARETVATMPPRRRLRGPLAVAAGFVLLVAGGWLLWNTLRPAASDGYGPWRSLEQVYAAADTGELDFWVCEDEKEFIDTFVSHYAQPLMLGDLPGDVETLGLAYCRSLSPTSTCVLSKVDGRMVVVVVDRIERDRVTPPSPGSGLNRFRGTVGALVLYEITPLDEPRLIDHLVVPDRGTGR
jgi:hypothetical protein